jgi:hypothetical protein
LDKVVSLYVILIPQLKAPQDVISPTNGIRAHGGVRQGGKVKKVPFADGEWEQMVSEPMAGCMYFEPTQVYIAQDKPSKSPHSDLGKRPNNESAQGSHG